MDYKKILKRSWETTKTYKVLWVFGMALAALSGLGWSGGGGGSESSSGSSELNFPEIPALEEIPQQSSQILGAATGRIFELFLNIPVGVWIILGISILFAGGVAVIISIVICEWARGSLIASIFDVEDQKPISLRSGSQHGLAFVKIKRF